MLRHNAQGMDYLKHRNSKVHKQLLSHNSKRSIKFLLFISLFCLLFSLLPLYLHSFKPFLVQFYAYTVDKTYMFLLCNGLLVLIALNSGLIDIPSPQTTHLSIQLESEVSDIAAPIAGENLVEIESSQEEDKILIQVEQENVLSDTTEDDGEERNGIVIIDEDDGEERNGIVIIDEEEHDADDTDELNKKCEEFIKKIKEEIRLENLHKKIKAEMRADYSLQLYDNQSMVAIH